MAIKRFEGDDIRNPIYVLRDSDIPRAFNFPVETGGATETSSSVSNPSIKYYPYSEEFPDVPPILVIDAEDLRKLYPEEEISDNVLAYFVVKSIRINLIQEFVNEYATGPFQFSIGAPGNGMGYYFVGQVEEAKYCSGAPRIDYYTLNSERPLEVNLAGKNLERIEKVYFQYPNGVIKEAEIKEGNTDIIDKPIITVDDIWRTTASTENFSLILDYFDNFDLGEKITISPSLSLSSDGFALTRRGHKLTKQQVEQIISDEIVTLKYDGEIFDGAEYGINTGLTTLGGVTAGAGVGLAAGGPVGAAAGAAAGAIAGGGTAAILGVDLSTYIIYTDQYSVMTLFVQKQIAEDLELPLE